MKSTIVTIAELPTLGKWGYPDFKKGTKIYMPSDDFVVSYDRAGRQVSIFGEHVWQLIAGKHATNYYGFNFVSWAPKEGNTIKVEALVSEIKFLFGLFLWFRPRGQISPASLQCKLVMLRKLALFAFNNDISLFKILVDKSAFKAFISGSQNNNLHEFSALIVLLQHLGEPSTGIRFVGLKEKSALDKLCLKLKLNGNQVPPLPSNLYMAWIDGVLSDLDKLEKFIPDILSIMDGELKFASRRRGEVKKLIEGLEINAYFEHFDINKSVNGFANALSVAQAVCLYVILTFSGMRYEEARSLPFNCDILKKRKWGTSILLSSITTKGNRQGRETSELWVTNQDALRAVKIAQKIAEHLYKHVEACKDMNTEQYPFLFVSTGYITSVAKRKRSKEGIARTSLTIANLNGMKIQKNYTLKISSKDVLELQKIAPHRNWSKNERYNVGSIWNVTHQQLRRSLAIFASASGLVTLQSLKKQLKHLTREMTRYYTKGFRALMQFTAGDSEHFAHEYLRSQILSQEVSYFNNVVDSNEKLFGGHGIWVQRNSEAVGGVVSAAKRKTIHEDFLRGKIAYKETPLGGCTTVKPCTKHMMRIFTECEGCSDAVVIPSRVARTIRIMTIHVEKLQVGSVESRTDMSELAALTLLKKKIEGEK